MTPIFLDTVGLLAVWADDDQWHAAAVAVYDRIVRTGQPTVTTPLVLYECGNAASRSHFRGNVDGLRQLMRAEGQLIEPTYEEIETAWADYVRGVGGLGRHRRSYLVRHHAPARHHASIYPQ